MIDQIEEELEYVINRYYSILARSVKAGMTLNEFFEMKEEIEDIVLEKRIRLTK